MHFYYHHVGVEGAAEDFPKTVFTERSIRTVREHISDSVPQKQPLIGNLESVFPAGRFNCWGVPSGASTVMGNLESGDAVLLIVTTGEDGAIPALCRVECYYPVELRGLSRAFWGNEKYPYIFFFETIPLSLTWGEFLYHTGYEPNYDPRGKFLSIASDRLSSFGGPEGYFSFLLAEHQASEPPDRYAIQLENGEDVGDEKVSEDDPEYASEGVEEEFDKVITQSVQAEPDLTDDSENRKVKKQRTPRSEAFRKAIRRLYDERCSICGRQIYSPSGNPEVQSAHIYPKRFNGSDDLRNGVCLCRIHHWAFDVGWFSLSDDVEIIVRKSLPPDEDYEFIREFEGEEIELPEQKAFKPHPKFLRAHREIYEFAD
jgi:hypothetical protein